MRLANRNNIFLIILSVSIIIIAFFIYQQYFTNDSYQNQIDNQNLRNIFYNYLHQTKRDWNYITPKELNERIKDGNGNNIFLLDVRKPSDYHQSHIPGSVNIFWLDLLKEKNLRKLPKDKEIIIICYVGHTASQILVLLKLLGYNAKVLKFGMGISPDPNVPISGWSRSGYITERD